MSLENFTTLVTLGMLLAAAPSDAAANSIQDRIDAAPASAEVIVEAGHYQGPLIIDKPLTIKGIGSPTVDGGGAGTVISIVSPDVTVEGLSILGSGKSLDQENSGISVEAARARILDNTFDDVLFGVYLKRAPDSVVRGNSISGKKLDIARRGDAIRIWYSNNVVVENNLVARARDVVLWYSNGLTILNNTVRDGRYGLHFMYCDDARIEANLLSDNSVGAFLMYSQRLRLIDNTIVGNHGPSGYGVGLKDMDDAVVTANVLIGNRVGVFLDNSPREIDSTSLIADNLFAGNDIGISLLPNVRRGRFLRNSFEQNAQQVEVAGGGGDPDANRWHGNYWSDYSGYDADSNGVGDLPYRSERIFDDLTDRHRSLRLFVGSPVLQALSFAGRAFPLVKPRPRLIDQQPMMTPVGARPVDSLAADPSDPLTPVGATMLLGALALLLTPRIRLREHSGESQPTRSAAIEVTDLQKHFGSFEALRSLSFSIPAGRAVALWGHNGAGKTTVMRAMLGLFPYRGHIRVGGYEPRTQGKDVGRLVGFVPQETGFPANLTVDETIEFFARLRRSSDLDCQRVVARLGLEGERDKLVSELSGGWKQRLALAIALLEDPPILFLDEPTANLDSDSRQELLALLQELKNDGRTLVFSSHRPNEVVQLADRVFHLDAGVLIAESCPSEMFGSIEIEFECSNRDDAERLVAVLAGSGRETVRHASLVTCRLPDTDKTELLRIAFSAEANIRNLEFSTFGVAHERS